MRRALQTGAGSGRSSSAARRAWSSACWCAWANAGGHAHRHRQSSSLYARLWHLPRPGAQAGRRGTPADIGVGFPQRHPRRDDRICRHPHRHLVQHARLAARHRSAACSSRPASRMMAMCAVGARRVTARSPVTRSSSYCSGLPALGRRHMGRASRSMAGSERCRLPQVVLILLLLSGVPLICSIL